jgi:hypothetical protein
MGGPKILIQSVRKERLKEAPVLEGRLEPVEKRDEESMKWDTGCPSRNQTSALTTLLKQNGGVIDATG